MEARNLRIGNFVRAKSPEKTEWVEAHKISAHTLYSMEYPTAMDFVKPDMEPIPLTKKWLDKFGFDDSEYKEGYTGVDYRTNLIMDFVLTKPNFMGEWQNYYTYDLGQHRFVALHYVHELQNLFFAVTTTELELKTDV